MADKHAELLKRLLATFRIEADEHLVALTSLLLTLEGAPDGPQQRDAIENLFREVHSLKGAARAVNLSAVEQACQSLEDLIADVKKGTTPISDTLCDVMHRRADALRTLLASALDAVSEPGRGGAPRVESPRPGPEAQGARGEPTPLPPGEAPAGGEGAEPGHEPSNAPRASSVGNEPPAGTVRVAAAKLDDLLFEVEELVSFKHAFGERVAALRALWGDLGRWEREWGEACRDGRSMLRALEKRSGEPQKEGAGLAKLAAVLDRGETLSKSLEGKAFALLKAVEQDHRALGGKVDTLLGEVKKIAMLPLTSVLELFPKLARDLARDRGKTVDFLIRGADIEVDKRILEQIKDPLVHLLRNAIDHGIEAPEVRTRKGKAARGRVAIEAAAKSAGKIDIVVSDDGAGVDADAVFRAAVKRGVVSHEDAERLDDAEKMQLIFRSGVTTSPIITDLSGRGLGLAIVREKAEDLGGAVRVEKRPEGGTAFRLTLPATLTTFRGLLVRVEDRLFVLPSANVVRAARVSADDIKTVENRATMRLDGRTVAVLPLGDALELPRYKGRVAPSAIEPAVVVGLGDARIAFRVTEVLGEREVLVKGLGPQLLRVRNVAGATVLGTGKIVPVLHVPDLMKSAARAAASTHAEPVAEAPDSGKAILVAEDSITARTLVKNILEVAGYQVTTAVDGAEAFSLLKTGRFDLLVSDVDMPRMNGFGLTAKIRADKDLSELPVVLVTALESREDRERGIDAGANAYVVKSSFDQSNLLDIIQGLL